MAYRVILEAGTLRCSNVKQVVEFVSTLPKHMHQVAIIDEAEAVAFTPKDFLSEVMEVVGWKLQQELYNEWFHSGKDYLEQQLNN